MRIIKDIKEMYLYSLKAKNRSKSIGFVPTMGFLHEGHFSLIEAAREKTDLVVVSVFVNPIQFGPQDDFTRYPRDHRRDKKFLKNFDVDVLFMPPTSKIFPDGFNTYVEAGELSKKMCGRSRPTHFRGVTTIVTKLFNVVAPTHAFFGEKDHQQLLIIRRMTKDLDLPIEIIGLPTVRDFDGLAKSSRNEYLNTKERKSATILYKALSLAREEIEGGQKDIQKILLRMRSLIGSEPSIRLDYVVLADPDTLVEIKKIKGKILVALAGHLGHTRLIDNIIVKAK